MKVRSRITSFAIGSSLLLCFTVASAQTLPRTQDAPAKFDEYGSLGGCDHSARLDNLAIQLQQAPGLKAQVIYYGPERAGEQTQAIIRDYLVNSRGIDDERVESTYGGPNDDLKEPRVQLWLAPSGSCSRRRGSVTKTIAIRSPACLMTARAGTASRWETARALPFPESPGQCLPR